MSYSSGKREQYVLPKVDEMSDDYERRTSQTSDGVNKEMYSNFISDWQAKLNQDSIYLVQVKLY